MANAGGTQALIAAFGFGLVALASTVALYRFVDLGNRPTNGDAPVSKWMRLVLITFFLSSALWSIIDFAATLTSGDANPACQILVVIAATFDQLARVTFEEFLLLRINLDERSGSILLLQSLLGARFVIGGVLVAVQRPQDFSVCIAKNILVPLGIATLITDVLIVFALFVLIWKRREFIPPNIQTTRFAPAKILTFLTAGFAAWLATSIPLIFGLEAFAFATRTVVPSVGLLILIGLVVLFRSYILFSEPLPQSGSTSPDTSKALPSRPDESRDTDPPRDVFNRPWADGSQRLHIAQTQKPSTGPLSLLKPGSRATSTTLLVLNPQAPSQSRSGVDGTPARGQLFPPIRAATAPIVLQNPPKRQPKGKLAISNPVIRESSALKIENEIATMDLATAAKRYQERAVTSSAMAADRASQSQAVTRTLQESSFKRKDGLAANSVPAMLSERPLLQPKAATTGTKISPSADELRRRSPRATLSTSKLVLSPPPRSPRRPPQAAMDRSFEEPPAIPPQSPMRKNGSGSSVLRDNSGIFIDPGTPPEIPTPLRQENANWPRAGAAESPLVPRVEPLPMPLSKAQLNTTPPTAYKSKASASARASILTRSGPGSVRRDIRPSRQRPDSREAEKSLPAPAKTPVQLRAVTGIPVNPRAQRTNDVTDETGERGKAIMFSNQAVADGGEEGTVSRQIQSLSLANSSPSTDSIVHRPRPIPRKRSIYKAEYTIKVSPTVVYRHRLSRSGGSVELQRASMESEEDDTISRIPSFPEPPRSAGALGVNYLKISDNASKTVTPGSIDEFYSSGISYFANSTPYNAVDVDPETAPSESTEFGSRASVEPEFAYNVRRQSSPVLPVEEMRHVSMLNPAASLSELKSVPSSARSSTTSQHDGDEIVPLILDTDPEGSYSGLSSQRNSLGPQARWHRRVGDVCPTFSDRKNGQKSPRRVLAPTPLLLGRSSKPTRIAESPVPPLESPQHALDIIQQQLRELDEADSESGSEDKQRRKLLENLEAEMGAQETHWLDIRRNLADRSPSSARSSRSLLASGDLHLASSPPSPVLRSPDLGLPVIGRGMDPTSATATENNTKTPADDEKSDPAASELTVRSNSGFTDQGSAPAILGEVENRAKFGKSESRNKDGLVPTTMTNDISALRQPANHPTASETNKTEEDVEKVKQTDSASAKNYNFSAWTEPRPVNFASPLPVSHWSIDSDTAALASETLQQAADIAEEPSNPVRNFASTSPLIGDGEGIQARQSFNKALASPTSSSSLPRENLVSTAVSEQTQSPHRPVTQRPPRRSKRITLLPDIPESPKPLSDSKHNTLGFFRFPWGETSDIATLQPQLPSAFSVPLPGATLASQGPVLPSEVYPASFFDHYSDDELPAADSDEGYSDDEDEAFDETTLWEIANLLRSSAVPSRGSLFPGSEEYRPPSRAGFASTDETTVLAVRTLPTAILEDSTLGNKDKALPPLPPSDNSVWTSDTMYTTTARKSAGLAQPDAKTWRQYLGKQDETLRAAPRKSEPASITSTSLWLHSPKNAEPVATAATSGLWQSSQDASPVSTAPSTPFLTSPSPTEFSMNQPSAPVKTTPQPHGLWTPPAPVARVFFGLPQEEGEWSRYTAKKIRSSRPRPRPSAQDVIRSSSLWTSSKPASAAPAAPATPAAPAAPATPAAPAAPATPAAPAAPAPSLTSIPNKPILPIQLLWSQPAALSVEQTEGLWNASHIRDQYKTTEKRPAALDTARKLRIDRRPLATLSSASLWSTTTQTPTRQVPNWLALSTTLRPVSPGGASTLSDPDSASVSDTYSLRSELTSASSVAASKQPAHRKTASLQAAQEELDAAFREVMQSKPVIPAAVAEEEVIEQQHQEEKLEEKEELFFDSSRFHPVFAVDVLHVTSDNVHPAATGYLHSIVNGAPKPRRR